MRLRQDGTDTGWIHVIGGGGSSGIGRDECWRRQRRHGARGDGGLNCHDGPYGGKSSVTVAGRKNRCIAVILSSLSLLSLLLLRRKVIVASRSTSEMRIALVDANVAQGLSAATIDAASSNRRNRIILLNSTSHIVHLAARDQRGLIQMRTRSGT